MFSSGAGATDLTKTTDQPAQARQPPQSFNWRRGKDLLFPTYWVHSVVLSGKVYVRGMASRADEDDYTIQVYTPEYDEWSRLQCPVRFFALAVVNEQLIVLGGEDHSDCRQSTLFVWDTTSQSWTTPYPDMTTARTSPGAIGYQHYLVVAGGHFLSFTLLNTVDILDTTTKQWFSASPLPFQSSDLSSAMVGDTLYLLGGDRAGKRVLSVSLPALVSHALSTSQAPPPKWEETMTKLEHSTAVSLHNSILAVGGRDDNRAPSSAIHLYDPQTKQWSKIGDTPEPALRCGCAVLSSGELVLVGGNGTQMMLIASVN